MYRDCETTYINIREQIKAFEEEAKLYSDDPKFLKDLEMECYMLRKRAGDSANKIEKILRTMNRDKQKNRNK